jgi:hypothetical protein
MAYELIPLSDFKEYDYSDLLYESSYEIIKYVKKNIDKIDWYRYIDINSDFVYELVRDEIAKLNETLDKLNGVISYEDKTKMENTSRELRYTYENLCESNNPNILKLIPLEYIDWVNLASNSSKYAVKLLKEKFHNANERLPQHVIISLAGNSNSEALELLDKYLSIYIKKFTLIEKRESDYSYSYADEKMNTERIKRRREFIVSKLSGNSNSKALEILTKYFEPNEIDWSELLVNEANWAIFYVLDSLRKEWFSFKNENFLKFANSNYYLYELYEDYFINNYNSNKLPFQISNNCCLCGFDWSIELLQKYPEKIHWGDFAKNRNPKATRMIFEKLKEISTVADKSIILNTKYSIGFYYENYENFRVITKDNLHYILFLIYDSCNNSVKCEILNYYGIDINQTSKKKSMFFYKYNYTYLQERIAVFKEELIAYVWNPERFEKWPENPFLD